MVFCVSVFLWQIHSCIRGKKISFHRRWRGKLLNSPDSNRDRFKDLIQYVLAYDSKNILWHSVFQCPDRYRDGGKKFKDNIGPEFPLRPSATNLSALCGFFTTKVAEKTQSSQRILMSLYSGGKET